MLTATCLSQGSLTASQPILVGVMILGLFRYIPLFPTKNEQPIRRLASIVGLEIFEEILHKQVVPEEADGAD